jgi:hypothetical protein
MEAVPVGVPARLVMADHVHVLPTSVATEEKVEEPVMEVPAATQVVELGQLTLMR